MHLCLDWILVQMQLCLDTCTVAPVPGYLYQRTCAWIGCLYRCNCAWIPVLLHLCLDNCINAPVPGLDACTDATVPGYLYCCTCAWIPVSTHLCLDTCIDAPVPGYLYQRTCAWIPVSTHLCLDTCINTPVPGWVLAASSRPCARPSSNDRQSWNVQNWRLALAPEFQTPTHTHTHACSRSPWNSKGIQLSHPVLWCCWLDDTKDSQPVKYCSNFANGLLIRTLYNLE